MYFLLALVLLMLALAATGWAYSRRRTAYYEGRHPAVGSFETVGTHRLHYLMKPARDFAGAPVIVFLHGASANLQDPLFAYEGVFDGSCTHLYVDRPGHGWSSGGADVNGYPVRQAELIAGLLDILNIETAVFVAHSYGCAVLATLAVNRPDKVEGLVFLSPATHPWPGGVAWHNHLASASFVGWLFTRIAALPVAERVFASAVKDVFAPDPTPDDYVERTATELVFRPENFRNNCRDIAGLHRHVLGFFERYQLISAPTIIVTGTRDSVVLPGIHSRGLERAIAGSQVRICDGAGHMPHHACQQEVMTAIADVLNA